ncbi:hypothetical protein SAMN05444487_10510 [Marininema mesophilum]|uniref:Uncharacterized protein n=1 Tax=Marininema mesophilum TaxID=1048340 RepID=A0A1H2V724_9BACL|nr:hypothetical protein [Marininema mesophilum]SDW64060.1 hypothetical protein SAMN05444487_10510 [Marininema mesophilum]
MNVRKIAILFMALFTFIVVNAVPAYADKDYDPKYFKTEDGKYEQTIQTINNDDVTVDTFDVKKVNKSTGEKSDGSPSSLDVRLCSSSSGNCTSWKNLSIDAYFWNMKAGTYYIDIRDKYASYYYTGYVTAKVWNDPLPSDYY